MGFQFKARLAHFSRSRHMLHGSLFTLSSHHQLLHRNNHLAVYNYSLWRMLRCWNSLHSPRKRSIYIIILITKPVSSIRQLLIVDRQYPDCDWSSASVAMHLPEEENIIGS